MQVCMCVRGIGSRACACARVCELGRFACVHICMGACVHVKARLGSDAA